MKFNLEDLKKGNVSRDEINRLINYVVYNRIKSQLDNRFHKEEDLKITANWLLETAKGTIIFKTSFDPSQDGSGDKKTYNENLTAHKRAIDSKRFLRILSLMEHYKVLENLKAQLDSELGHLAELKENDRKKYLIEEANQNKLFAARMEKQIERIKEDVRAYIENLHKSIAVREATIRAARIYHADRIIAQADNIIIDGKKFFEGMSKPQIENFVNGRLAIIEFKERKLLELEHKRDQALARLDAMPIDNKDKQVLLQSKKHVAKDNIHRVFNEGKEKLDKMEVSNLRRLVKETGCQSIDPNTNDKTFMAQVGKYDNHHIVKAEQGQFANLVRHECKQILLENDLSSNAEKVKITLSDKSAGNVRFRVAEEFLKQVHSSSVDYNKPHIDEFEFNLRRIQKHKEKKRSNVIESIDSEPDKEISNKKQRTLESNQTESDFSLHGIDEKDAAEADLEGLDIDAFDIEFDTQEENIQGSINEIAAASIEDFDSMDQIDFSGLRATSASANEALPKKTNSI